MAAPSPDSQILRSMELLATRGSARSYRAGEVIFAAGDPGDCLFGVLAGQVGLAWSDNGELELLGPGRVFGEGALAQGNHTRQATATALLATRLLVMDRETFLFVMEALPIFGLEMLASLESRLQAIRQRPDAP